MQTRTAVLNALMAMNNEMYVVDYAVGGQAYTGCYDITTHQVDAESDMNTCGDQILNNVLNTPGLVRVNTQEHLGSYSALISHVPGIAAYYNDKYEIQ